MMHDDACKYIKNFMLTVNCEKKDIVFNATYFIVRQSVRADVSIQLWRRPYNARSWLEGYADQSLYQETRQCGAEKKHMISRLSTTMYLDSLRSDTYSSESDCVL